jgi:hypothetical protein
MAATVGRLAVPARWLRFPRVIMTTIPKFVLQLPEGEEGLHIFMVNGVEVGRCDHDTAGWQGMADQLSMFRAIAGELKAEVEEDWGEE